jgi:cyclopropane fatty-acyl-phospholipid synthase-like methyltransferase
MRLFDKLALVLSLPAGYRLLRGAVGGEKLWHTYLDEYVKPQPGEKVLDVGCGPADVLSYMPNVEYTGLDHSSEYIHAAKKRFGNRGRFWCTDVSGVGLEKERGTFDLAMATGVIHHLNDEQAADLFSLVRVALRPGGRLITFDGCFVPDQSRLARWILRNDRGKFVRTSTEYERLASKQFSAIESYLRNDLLRIPYTHLIMRCRNQADA